MKMKKTKKNISSYKLPDRMLRGQTKIEDLKKIKSIAQNLFRCQLRTMTRKESAITEEKHGEEK